AAKSGSRAECRHRRVKPAGSSLPTRMRASADARPVRAGVASSLANSSPRRCETRSSTAMYSASLESKWRYTTSRLMPAAAATSSIDVAAKPRSANAIPAAERIEMRRFSSLGTSQVYTQLFTLGLMPTAPLEWTQDELLETHAVTEPLIAGGVRCHGGFDDHGRYVSPRTKNRVPAIAAWQEHHRHEFGTPLLDIELESWPEHYPNVAQAKYLLSEGVTRPLVSILTRVGTVERFGSMIRYSVIPDLQGCFTEDVRGTAMAHLGGGLYEAHARDEAGHDDEGGHKQMWFAARDVAFENPVTEDETALMMERMGLTQGA